MSRQSPIMVVDNDARVLKGLILLLSKKYDVIAAEEGMVAIDLVKKHDICCVVLDVKMPGMNGFEVYNKIKQINENIPIIFYTAYHSEHDLSTIINKYRPYGYIEKGLSASILKNLVESAVTTFQIHKEGEQSKKELKEANTALRVLVRNIEKEKNDLTKSIYYNLKTQVLPYLHDAIALTRNRKVHDLLKICEDNVTKVGLPPAVKTTEFLSLTPKELRVVNLIKSQKSTKEIAEILSISIKTVEFHRRNIRVKLKLKNKKTNLHAYLSSIG